jgi:transcriptional regulator with XRE-family HTH domain
MCVCQPIYNNIFLMSHSAIKNNINRLLKERDWRVGHLEKKLGSTRAVTNILRGRSKNPTIDVLYSIAKAFNVEIQELIVEPTSLPSVNISLFSDTCSKVIKEIQELPEGLNISHNNLLSLIKESYEYSKKLNIEQADTNFIKWIISQYYG